jgi:hypothetical protein
MQSEQSPTLQRIPTATVVDSVESDCPRSQNRRKTSTLLPHAVIAELDEKGNLLWDHSIDLNNIKEDKLIQKIVQIV